MCSSAYYNKSSKGLEIQTAEWYKADLLSITFKVNH